MRLCYPHVSTKFEENRSKNTLTITKNVFQSPPIASQHQNSKLVLHHYTRTCHTYHVLSYEEQLSVNKKMINDCERTYHKHVVNKGGYSPFGLGGGHGNILADKLVPPPWAAPFTTPWIRPW